MFLKTFEARNRKYNLDSYLISAAYFDSLICVSWASCVVLDRLICIKLRSSHVYANTDTANSLSSRLAVSIMHHTAASPVHQRKWIESVDFRKYYCFQSAWSICEYVVIEMNEMVNKYNVLLWQINLDDYCGDESEEKNPYPANDYIGNTQPSHKPYVCEVRNEWMSR